MDKDTRQELLDAQVALCEEKGSPHFMPGNGICWHCHGDMVTRYGDRLKTEVITGCPLCCRTYCD